MSFEFYRFVYWVNNPRYASEPVRRSLALLRLFSSLESAQEYAFSVFKLIQQQQDIVFNRSCGSWAWLCLDSLDYRDGFICSRLDYSFRWVV